MANLEDMNITKDELDKIQEAFKNDEFKKLFFEYCEEMQNPESRKLYEKEIIQLEAERGVECKFVHPEPGFVIKTSIDDKTKGFINIATNKLVDKPTRETKFNEETGRKGDSWQIPYFQGQPHNDYDKKNQRCFVYDVVFHPDALQLASQNKAFRQHLVDTAFDAVEREFKVTVDRTNKKFPKLKYKGLPKPTVIRKLKKGTTPISDPNPLDSYMPPMPETADKAKPKSIFKMQPKKPEDYKTPKYVIKHRCGVDYAEMTYHLDAKLNLTIPKEIVVEIELPLLNSTADCKLDVTEKQLYLISEKPAKYQLKTKLPYKVDDKLGSAQFDKIKKKLIVVLPVCKEVRKEVKDLLREDSGIDTDETPSIDSAKLIEVLPSEVCVELNSMQSLDNENPNSSNLSANKPSPLSNTFYNSDYENGDSDAFLKNKIEYKFPQQFNCNFEDDHLVYILHIKNVDHDSIMHMETEKTIHVKFLSIGSGFYPIYYSFYCQLECDKVKISKLEAQAWDNNLILTLSLKDSDQLKKFSAGINSTDTTLCYISEKCLNDSFKATLNEEAHSINAEIKSNECGDGEVEINIKPELLPNNESPEKTILQQSLKAENNSSEEKVSPGGIFKKRKNNKKTNNKKQRSYSESECYDLKSVATLDSILNTNEIKSSSAPTYKGILKRCSRYSRSVSESCYSLDESYSVDPSDSIACVVDNNNGNLSESCKKTVRFSEVIHKQLFRLDSSILGQKKKNQKRKMKKLRRRNSESDSVDYDDKASSPKSPPSFELAEKKGKFFENKKQRNLKRSDSESDNDLNNKNNLMFDLEM